MLNYSAREIVAEAMRVMLLRHAKSKKAQGGMSDHARRLKGRGKSDAPVIGAYMARHELIPDLVLVSTAERARQTWERLATALPAPPRVVYEDRLYNAGADAIIALVKGTAGGPAGPAGPGSPRYLSHPVGLQALADLLFSCPAA